MRYFPHTEDDVREMLDAIGADSVDALFAAVPESCRFTPDLPDPLDEWQLRRRLEALAARIGAVSLELPEEFTRAWAWLDCSMERELAENLASLRDRENELNPPLRGALERGRQHTDADLRAAEAGRAALRDWGRTALAPFDCVLTPAATGPAPRLEDGAGSPVFSTVWNLMGAPCLCLPAFTENGLPVGAQLTAAPGGDAALLAGAAVVKTFF